VFTVMMKILVVVVAVSMVIALAYAGAAEPFLASGSDTVFMRQENDDVERTYTVSVTGKELNIRAIHKGRRLDDELNFHIGLTEADGPRLRAFYFSNGPNGRNRFWFKLMIKRIIEYIPDENAGYQKGNDTVVKIYPGRIGSSYYYGNPQRGAGGWKFGPWIEANPGADRDREFNATTEDGAFWIRVRINPTPSVAAGILPIGLNDVKLDYGIDLDRLRELGFLMGEETDEIAILGAIQAHLKRRLCEKANETGSTCFSDVDGSSTGFVRWLNTLDCPDGEQLRISAVTALDDDTEGDSEIIQENSRATLLSWSLGSPHQVYGTCVWDPVVALKSHASSLRLTSAAASFVAFVLLFTEFLL